MPDFENVHFRNRSWQVIRVFFVLGLVFLAIGLLPLAVVWCWSLGHTPVTAGMWSGCQLTLFISLPFAVAMVLSALLTVPTARQTDRCFDEFRQGDLLADWTYTPEEWEAFVTGETKRRRRAGWMIFGLCGGVSAAIFIIIAWAASATTTSRLMHCGDVLAGLAGISIAYLFLLRWIVNSRASLLRANPKALISRRAVFCGGDFNIWGTQLWSVHRATVKQDPPVLEIVVGYTKNAGRAMQAIDLLSAVSGHPSTTASMINIYRIPIPADHLPQALEIAKLLMPITASAKPKQVAPKAEHSRSHLAAEPIASTRVSHPHRVRHWWLITAGAFALGLTCFILVIPLDAGRTANQPSSAATMIAALLGCLLWIVCVIAFIYAVIVTWRTRSKPR